MRPTLCSQYFKISVHLATLVYTLTVCGFEVLFVRLRCGFRSGWLKFLVALESPWIRGPLVLMLTPFWVLCALVLLTAATFMLFLGFVQIYVQPVIAPIPKYTRDRA